MVGKEEVAGNQYFPVFLQGFLPIERLVPIILATLILSSAIASVWTSLLFCLVLNSLPDVNILE